MLKLSVNGAEVLAAGILSDSGPKQGVSPNLPIFYGARTRVVLRYGVYASSGASGRATVGVVFLKRGEPVPTASGGEVVGVTEEVNGPVTDVLSERLLVLEHSLGVVSWWAEGLTRAKAFLSTVPDSFRVVLRVDEAEGGRVGAVVEQLDVYAYDVVEDVISVIVPAMSYAMMTLAVGYSVRGASK